MNLSKSNLLLLTTALLAHLPLGVSYAVRMWRTGHYQFFPLLAGFAFWLIYERAGKCQRTGNESKLIHYGLWSACIGLLTVSVLLYSSFMWSLSFLTLVATAVYTLWGSAGVRRALPAWLLLFFIVPLPMNLDVRLITNMQFMASQLASWILDALGQIHFREGIVLVTEKKQFFTEEACSGVRSLFSSLAAIAIYGVINEYKLGRHLFNLLQTVVWVLIGNAFRVALVVFVADNWTEEIATGTSHEMLGLAIFVGIFLLALCTDRFLTAWQLRVLHLNPENSTGQNEFETRHLITGTSFENPIFKFGILGLFAVVTILGARLTYAKMTNESFRVTQFKNDDFSPLVASDLPMELAGWKQSEFEHKFRNEASLLAPESFIWTYAKDGKKVSISLDGPYPEFHHLADCYNGLGWSLSYQHRYDSNEQSGFTELELSKKNEKGFVIFTALDRTGRTVVPKESNIALSAPAVAIQNVRLALGVVESGDNAKFLNYALPISQLQLFQTSEKSLSPAEDLKIAFAAAREILRQTHRFK